MILRDPVHGLVAFEGLAEQVIERLLATREVQRLRNVRQLGFTSLVFPGAEHSRFAHSLGAAHVMGRMLARIRAIHATLPLDQRIDDEAEADALAAALLHDLGHGPFSHLFEDVIPGARRHEAWTLEIVLDDGTDVNRALRTMSAGMPERVASLIDGKHRLSYLGRCISGELDADRCDYLLRDSHMTGVSYGVYDLDWLLQALCFGQLPGGEWVLAIEGRKGLPPIEGFFLARQFMYQQVYHHKATRAAEMLIRAIFMRAAELAKEGSKLEHAPAALLKAATGEAVTLAEYLALDDVQLLSCFRAWEHGEDATLARLTDALARRELPKTVPLPADGQRTGTWDRALSIARDRVAARGLRPDLWVWLDVPSDAPYEEPADDSAKGLWVVIRHQPIQRLGGSSFLLGQLRNQRIERPRLIFPSEVRAEVLAAIEQEIS
ncbi:MAG: HD domain-containing protein [Myxococcales bacterium]|nr:HD domain-containing protein [Myxococcales bacterium]